VLKSEGAEVLGTARTPVSGETSEDRPRTVPGDLTQDGWIAELLQQQRPTHVIHLAGVAEGAAGGSLVQYEVNLIATLRLLEAIRSSGLDPWILVASSSAVYGDAESKDLPLTEDEPFRPVNHYGVSKAAQELAALGAFLNDRLRTVRVRTFNLIGPGQPSTLVASDLARQIAQAERADRPVVLRVGNLAARRDYTDVRDAARAYALLAARAEAGEVYNVCSGRSHAVQECVDILSRLARVPVTVQVDEARMRPVDLPNQVGSPDRLRAATGWEPRIPLDASLKDLLEMWRQRVDETVAT
jgi:GDP-4-dehydro-6-deoxy-D-mannose reductase